MFGIMQYPQRLEKLFSLLQKLPGVGRRTAQRYAFDLLLRWLFASEFDTF